MRAAAGASAGSRRAAGPANAAARVLATARSYLVGDLLAELDGLR